MQFISSAKREETLTQERDKLREEIDLISKNCLVSPAKKGHSILQSS